MPISNSEELFSLIKSLTKAEKRNFRLYANRNYSQSQLKFIELFEILDKADAYNEIFIQNKLGILKAKLSNLKRHLYTQILSSLRIITSSKKPNMEVREMVDYAYILYYKSFYLEAIKILEKAKRKAQKYNMYHMQSIILEFEKRIESRHITRSGLEKAYALKAESEIVNKKLSAAISLSNLRIDLNARYIQYGHCKSLEEKRALQSFFAEAIQNIDEETLGVVEKIYLFQSYVWYYYMLIDFENCRVYAQKWLGVLESSPEMIEKDVDLYLRAYHYILSSCYHLRWKDKFNTALENLEGFRKANYKGFNDLTKIISFQYVHISRLNNVIIRGEFDRGQAVITKSLKRMSRYGESLDEHRVLVFYFKFAWIYFGDENYTKSIHYLNKIINNELPKLRVDLQVYARIMFLMCHYELENYDLFTYAIQSFKPYAKKVASTYPIQEVLQDMFVKIGNRPLMNHTTILKEALSQLKELRKNDFYMVSFNYLNVIAWLEAKISRKSLSEIVKAYK